VKSSDSVFLCNRLSKEHDRAKFSCEAEPLERYLKQQANQDFAKDLSVAYVLVPEESPRFIAGYYTLCSDTILVDDLPPELLRKLRIPHYRSIPATLIGRLARDLSYKGQGLGELLVTSALRLACQTSQTVASWGVTVDANDDKAQRFYQIFGCLSFPDRPLRLYLPMSTVEQVLSASRG